MDEDFTEMIGREFRDIYKKIIDAYVDKMIYSEETGEPRGILNVSPDTVLKRMRIAPTRIAKEAP